ncbi:PIN domain-containing protein [Bifidobacterium sp. DSM 109960]|uniref:PIN domain-containing protein n=1 Tax=Bifidobacterium erythrocebi TaxID=2675325 RepID=A0A7Y0EV78_9BIFI|nr:PIN domain-containing protein [Bifidobacterium sp. DSM 109960]NMM96598.1 PIN domain-containing protein [Bifidobacterium sp. DSM 109960]
MARPVAVLDANVFPTTWLLDILLTLDEHNRIDAVWSERILTEVRRTLIERQHRNPVQVESFLRAICSMNATHCAYGWEPREPMLELPDPDDRHVLAAALVAGADYIVTYNLKDFPPERLKRYPVSAIHPDDFLCLLLERNRNDVLDVMNEVVSSKDNPPRTMREEIAHLRMLRLDGFSEKLEKLLHLDAQ